MKKQHLEYVEETDEVAAIKGKLMKERNFKEETCPAWVNNYKQGRRKYVDKIFYKSPDRSKASTANL